MARPKRMGAYNALDELPPGQIWGAPDEPAARPGPPPPRPRLEPVPDLPRPARRRRSGRTRAGDALDDLLPGPRGPGALDDLLPGPRNPGALPDRPAPRLRSAGRHLAAWNPLDDLAPAPREGSTAPPKARLGFRLPAEVVEAARDAVAHLAGTPDRTTLTALAERALRAELARLAAAHNRGRPFPPRPPRPPG
jgi:hypothetical protein